MANGFRIEGLDELIRKLDGLSGDNIDEALVKAIRESSELTLKALKENTPVDKGPLQKNEKIEYSDGGKAALIGPDDSKTPYGIWVEVGHHTRSGSFVPGQHYIERTSVQVKKPVLQIFSKAIEELTNK